MDATDIQRFQTRVGDGHTKNIVPNSFSNSLLSDSSPPVDRFHIKIIRNTNNYSYLWNVRGTLVPYRNSEYDYAEAGPEFETFFSFAALVKKKWHGGFLGNLSTRTVGTPREQTTGLIQRAVRLYNDRFKRTVRRDSTHNNIK